ncbi:EpsG family protein [Saccharicrinis sp. 156]|uniref:EpsG family protein n=1 Tax=Saccharicrinis sp. 156 TaxID=3417574 RepID=UPI003D355835
MIGTRSIDRRYLYGLFFLWPFLGFMSAVANYNSKDAKRIVYLFVIYYGFSYVIGNQFMDSSTYIDRFLYNGTLPFSELFKLVGGLYSSEDTVDIVEPLISFIVSRFTNHHSFLFAAYAALFGYFYLKSINLLYEDYRLNSGWNAKIFLVFFVCILSVNTINGVRMWTAAWVFFYGAYHVVLYKDKRYIILSLAACLVHWSYITANAVLIGYMLAGNKNIIYIPLALASFVVPNILTPYLGSVSVSGSIQNRVNNYTNQEYIQGVSEHAQHEPWFITLGNEMIFYYLVVAITIIYLYNRKKSLPAEKNLFSFILLFISFVNFGGGIPSLGNRFKMIFLLFGTLYVFLFSLRMHDRKIHPLTITGLFPMALYVAVQFRIGSEVINSWLFLPGLGLAVFAPGISLAELLFY